MKTLLVKINDDIVGTVAQREKDGRPVFTYGEDWLRRNSDFPLSLSMPTSRSEHGPETIGPFMSGLLPENTEVLARIGRMNHVSPNNPMAVLSVIGEDCPGALAFISSDRTSLDFLHLREHGNDILWLDDQELASRISILRRDRGATGRVAGDPGQFSLAGAQPKMAVYERDGRIGVPGGLIPTTTILKPEMPGLEGQLQNEHFCLRLAREVGLPAADSRVLHFGDQSVIAVSRFDRVMLEDGKVVRLHQEDMCQALAIMPDRKYQKEGGPGIADICTKVLSRASDPDDAYSFVRSVMLNTIIGGTDAHGKNFSILLGPDSVRLAPLYDINSLMPYAEFSSRSRLSMSVGGHYEIGSIQPRHWEREAVKAGLDPERVLSDYRYMVDILPDAVNRVHSECLHDGLTNPVLDVLKSKIQSRCQSIGSSLDFHALEKSPDGPGSSHERSSHEGSAHEGSAHAAPSSPAPKPGM